MMKARFMQECWGIWEPVSGLKDKYNIDTIEYTLMGGFIITFSECDDKEKKVTVTFKHGVLAHREFDEKLDHSYEKDFSAQWTFFKVTNSSYLKWLSEQSHTLSEYYSVTQYSFLAMNKTLDVVISYEPIVELVS
jgi:hypothetical protein